MDSPNFVHKMDADYCNRIIKGGESHFPKLKFNTEGYAFSEEGKPSEIHKRVELKVTVILDCVPGAFHNVEDHMNWLCQLPYVQQIEVIENDN